MFFQRTQENDNGIKTELSVGNNYQYSTPSNPQIIGLFVFIKYKKTCCKKKLLTLKKAKNLR